MPKPDIIMENPNTGKQIKIRNEDQCSPQAKVAKFKRLGWRIIKPEKPKKLAPPPPPKPRLQRRVRRTRATERKASNITAALAKTKPRKPTPLRSSPPPPEPPKPTALPHVAAIKTADAEAGLQLQAILRHDAAKDAKAKKLAILEADKEKPKWATVTKGGHSWNPHRPPVWYAIPSGDSAKAKHCLDQWSAMGYRTAVLLDSRADSVVADLVVYADKWLGYPAAVKRLCDAIGEQADIIITGGDDIYPDPKANPATIHAEFLGHFGGTMGVMQPTGDRWQTNNKGVAGTERVCMSPWMGRDFIKQINGGRGPFWTEYDHFFCDEELHCVAQRSGLLWHRRDLKQLHDHWSRAETGGGAEKKRPAYLDKAQAGWTDSKKLFRERKKAKFPGTREAKMDKIVALTIAHNEQWSLGFTGRATLKWADEVVFLNHNSDDKTRDIMADIKSEHRGRVTIIDIKEKRWSEMAHRQKTLDSARKRGATHCCVVDADEVLSANLLPMIRGWLLQLIPGQAMQLPWVCLWRGLNQYRHDNSIWSHSYVTTGFMDKVSLAWKARNGYEFHQRAPLGTRLSNLALRPIGKWEGGGLLHMQHVQWNRLLAKQAWYKMTERVMDPKRDKAEVINTRYDAAVNEKGFKADPLPQSWLLPYDDIRKHLRLDMVPWQIGAMKAMMAEHGPKLFAGLDLYGVIDE